MFKGPSSAAATSKCFNLLLDIEMIHAPSTFTLFKCPLPFFLRNWISYTLNPSFLCIPMFSIVLNFVEKKLV